MKKKKITDSKGRIPVVRITVKPDFYFYSDFYMDHYSNESVEKAKQDALEQIVKGLPRDKIVVRHTNEIIWVDDNGHIE